MSVILPTPDNAETIRRTVEALAAQTVAHLLELVIVAPNGRLRLDVLPVEGFAGIQLVPIGEMTTSNAARVAGIRAARAPIVALAEDHCFPSPTWAASLLAAHDQGCAAAGPVLSNANPGSAVSWSNFLAEYGHWVGKAAGEIDHLPGHNSSYCRALLLELSHELVPLMEAEIVLQAELRRRGHRLLLAPAAQADHYNFSLWTSSVLLRFNGGRLFAGHRIRGWGWGRRLMYAAGAPLIPLVRTFRIVRSARNCTELPMRRRRLLPVVLVLLVIDAAGELVGYLTGPGRAGATLAGIEFHRERYMNTSDRRRYQGALSDPVAAGSGVGQGL